MRVYRDQSGGINSDSHQSEAVCRQLGSVTIRHYNVFMPIAHDSLLYLRVETVLASEIAHGDLKVGDQLPTEDSLIARFGVSRITVRRAIQNLVSRGLVEIRRGKGTFVAAPKITQELTELSGFVEDMHALGRKPTARVISKEIVTADAKRGESARADKGRARRQNSSRAPGGWYSPLLR